MNAILALVAAGGGGAGSTDYCYATGGAGGGNAGLPGAFPGADTPFPITSSMEPTPVIRRFQYTSSACPEGILGASCISEWDILPHSLPADQNNLQYGQAPHENFTAWSGGGGGATGSAGGSSGTTGSYMVSASTHEFVPYGPGTSVVYSLIDGLIFAAEAGSGLQGGNGADGHDAGGGGGAGYFGGGGIFEYGYSIYCKSINVVTHRRRVGH